MGPLMALLTSEDPMDAKLARLSETHRAPYVHVSRFVNAQKVEDKTLTRWTP